jgi:hypothetical protein
MTTATNARIAPEVTALYQLRRPADVALDLVVFVWTIASVIVGSYEDIDIGNFYLSQPGLAGLTIALFVLRIFRRAQWRGLTALAVLMVVLLLPVFAGGTENERFVPEQLKVLMLLAGMAALATVPSWHVVRWLSIAFPLGVAGLTAFTYVQGTGYYYGDDRFGLPQFGSPNASSFVMVIALLLIAFRIKSRGKWSLFDIAVGAFVAYFLILTDSDGGKLTLALLVASFLGLNLRWLTRLTIALGVVTVATVLLDTTLYIPTLLGSGRLVIWQLLLHALFSGSLLHLLVGYGPGAIDLQVDFTASVRSAHSMFLELFYAYGLVGLTALLVFIYLTFRRLAAMIDTPAHVFFLHTLFVILVAGGLVDTYFMTAQLTWLGSLVLSWFALIPRTSAVQIASPSPPGPGRLLVSRG